MTITTETERREFDTAIAEYDEGRRGLDISYARCVLEHGRVLLALANRRYPLAQSGRRAAAAGNNKACNHD